MQLRRVGKENEAKRVTHEFGPLHNLPVSTLDQELTGIALVAVKVDFTDRPSLADKSDTTSKAFRVRAFVRDV